MASVWFVETKFGIIRQRSGLVLLCSFYELWELVPTITLQDSSNSFCIFTYATDCRAVLLI